MSAEAEEAVTPAQSPTLTDGGSDIPSPHTSPVSSKIYHITEPWDSDAMPSTSQPATPMSAGSPKPKLAWEEPESSTVSPITSISDGKGKAEGGAESPGACSTSTVENLVNQANMLIREANATNEKGSLEQIESKETSNNTTYRDLPRPVDSEKTVETQLADEEVELFNTDSITSARTSESKKPSRSQDDMDIDVAHKMDSTRESMESAAWFFDSSSDEVKSLMSESGWRDRRLKSFDYDALKQDLADIERRLQSARNQSGRTLWPEHASTPQRKSHSLHDIQGQRISPSPVDRTQSPDTLTSSGKASSLAELDRNRRLKWDYAADIASTHETVTPDAGLLGTGDDLNFSGEQRLRMSISQASFVSSPDPDDSALVAAMKTRECVALQYWEDDICPPDDYSDAPTTGSISARMEEILSREDPQSHVAAILRQADEAERRLRARLRQTADSEPQSYLDALRAADRESRTPGQEEGAWKRLNLSPERQGAGNLDSARSEPSNSGSARQAVPTSARSTTTAESTHVGSDDAMGPSFPPSAYGSRAEPASKAVRGIYYKPKSLQTATPQAVTSTGFPQRSRVAAVANEDVHRARPPASPSAGCSDLRKSLETISSHDTGDTTVPTHTNEDPHALEEYASKLRNKWERYQRLLSQHDRQDAYHGPRTPSDRRKKDEVKGKERERLSGRKERVREHGMKEAPREEKRDVGRGRDGDSGRRRDGDSGRGREKHQQQQQQQGRNNNNIFGRDRGRDSDDSDDWRRRRPRARQDSNDTGDETQSESQDTLQLMTRMAGLLRRKEVEEEDDQELDSTMSELDPQLLRLKHLFLKQKEKWLWERAREEARRRKMKKLQRMMAERIERRRNIIIEESLDTETVDSSILSQLEDMVAESDVSVVDTETADESATPVQSPPPPPPPARHPERKERKEKGRPSPARKTLPAKKDRRIQVYPPAQAWDIPAPGRDGEEKENRPQTAFSGIRRGKPSRQFVEKMDRLSSRENRGVQAAGGGLSWYHPVSARSVSEDESERTPRSRYEMGVQGDLSERRFEVPWDGVDPLVKLAQPLLTEAFEERMPDFISRSRERQKRIRLAAEERRYVSQMEAERVKLFTGDEAGGGVRRRPRTIPDPLSDNHHQPVRRAFTRKEIREQNRRIYRALPEVRQRVLDQRRSEQVKGNLLRKQLYSEKVLRAVLRKRGPWVVTF